ncbi:MAG: hypothetical protein WC797_01470 [Candidatus Paceibacterota bacterium]|jgi:hypothetical protein
MQIGKNLCLSDAAARLVQSVGVEIRPSADGRAIELWAKPDVPSRCLLWAGLVLGIAVGTAMAPSGDPNWQETKCGTRAEGPWSVLWVTPFEA